MKFEIKHPKSKVGDQHNIEDTIVLKGEEIGSCSCCNSMTRWIDVGFNSHVCSEECSRMLWSGENNDSNKRDSVRQELICGTQAKNSHKDILVVVHNQLGFARGCLESIRDHTENYTLWVWDNGSAHQTQQYLEVEESLCDEIKLVRSEENTGFIHPNNRLAEMGQGEYIILLNSDTKVFKGWSDVMLGYLQQNTQVKQVGYFGGWLDENGKGFGGGHGSDIDYIPGWCFCVSRETYNEYGLFDEEHLKFAYCEDADFSLRLREQGHNIFALSAPLVYHFGNKTIQEVHQKGGLDVSSTFEHNHEYMRKRWGDYLSTHRVTLGKDSNNVVNDDEVSGLG